jgi:hypothetical protein
VSRRPKQPELTDDDVREIARRLVLEVMGPRHWDKHLAESLRVLADADEDRVEAALVEMNAADYENTTMAERTSQM